MRAVLNPRLPNYQAAADTNTDFAIVFCFFAGRQVDSLPQCPHLNVTGIRHSIDPTLSAVSLHRPKGREQWRQLYGALGCIQFQDRKRWSNAGIKLYRSQQATFDHLVRGNITT